MEVRVRHVQLQRTDGRVTREVGDAGLWVGKGGTWEQAPVERRRQQNWRALAPGEWVW